MCHRCGRRAQRLRLLLLVGGERKRLAREHNYFSDEFNSKTAEIKPPLPDFVANELPSLAGHHPVTLYEKQIVGNYACEPQIKCSLFPPASSRSPARSARMRGHVSSASRASVLPPLLVPFRVTLRIGVQPAKAGMRNRAEAKPTRWTQAFFFANATRHVAHPTRPSASS